MEFESIFQEKIVTEAKKLLDLHGVSGHEEDVADYIKENVGSLVDEITTDNFGNVIAFRKGSTGKKLMITAHMDEIGMLVKHIDNRGFIYALPVGGVRVQNLFARKCIIKTEKDYIEGIINSIKPGRPNADENMPDINHFFIDVGADSIFDIEKMGIEVGQPVKFIHDFAVLNNKIVGTALDNRLLMLILISVLNLIKDADVEMPDIYAVFTAQEEVGSRGAKVATHSIKPDIAIVLDITMSNDLPRIHESEYISKLGHGPAIKAMDAIKSAMLGQIVSKKIIKELKDIAKKNNIPFQIEVQAAGSTDGATMHLVGGGVPVGVLCLPTRYVHAYEMADSNDITNLMKLLLETIKFYK